MDIVIPDELPPGERIREFARGQKDVLVFDVETDALQADFEVIDKVAQGHIGCVGVPPCASGNSRIEVERVAYLLCDARPEAHDGTMPRVQTTLQPVRLLFGRLLVSEPEITREVQARRTVAISV